jgi:YVTN family beta-propeller protein
MTRQLRRRLLGALAALGLCTGALAMMLPAGVAQAAAGRVQAAGHVGAAADAAEHGGHAAAAPGTDLLLNPGAQVGDYSLRGWDAVTIPGWQIASGLPTVVRYGTAKFPRVSGHQPAVASGQLFAGGAGGTARLWQSVNLRPPGGGLLPGGTRYRISGWLGGTVKSQASITVAFLSASGQVTGHATIGPVGHVPQAGIASRMATGTLPPGTVAARVTVVLATSYRDYNGPYAPYVGYNRAVADDLQFSVSAPVQHPPALVPPAVHVPRYQHVFLFYFENEDFHHIIGNTSQAPYFNSLLPKASLLAEMYAEEHPSDGNYLAIAGGSTFGVPLDDPLEENPEYSINARNIGDLVDAAHETWKGYLQSADGPCDDTVHGYYWNDDLPMTYFTDVRDRPAYCAAHLVPLQSLQTDLKSAATTPNFAWVSPNDCTDMESCGIKSGDGFLEQYLGDIMASPAWRTQRSLAIITFDEDSTDFQHPAQRIPTIIVGSRGVRQGYVSYVRYTHYSLLRTIEAALGLGTLTQNDRFAQPVNDIFTHAATTSSVSGSATSGRSATVRTAARTVARTGARTGRARRRARLAVAVGAPAVPLTLTGGVPASAITEPASGTTVLLTSAQTSAAYKGPETAFVVNSASASVTPVNVTTKKAGKPIAVGNDPQAIAVTRNGGRAFVVNTGSNTVTPINTTTRTAGAPIDVGSYPQAIAITPDGRTAFVANSGSGTVTPINTSTEQAGTPIRVGTYPEAIAITPNGKTAYVLDWESASVTPINTATDQAGAPIRVGAYPYAIAIAPDGAAAYVANYGSNTVTPISTATNQAGPPIPVGQAPDALAVSRDDSTVYAVGGDAQAVTPINATTGQAGAAIRVGYSPTAVGVSPSGATAYVVNTITSTVTPISTATGQAGPPIKVGAWTYPTAIAFAPSGNTAVVVSPYGDDIALLNTQSQRALKPIPVGGYPVAVAIVK